MADIKLKKTVCTSFKLLGFSLRTEACNFLVSQLLPTEENEREDWLERITEHVQKQSLSTPMIEKEHIEFAIQECVRNGLDKTETILNVISAFEVPKFAYNHERKKFIKVEPSAKEPVQQLFSVSQAKAKLYKDRYTLLLQRTSRHDLFTPTIMGKSNSDDTRKFNLRPIEFFLSSSKKVTEAIVLGLLTQLREGQYFLEDPSGILQLDLTETRYHTGLHTENCFVLAEGWYEDKVFHAQGIGFPPPETSAASRAYFGSVNTFGGLSAVSLKTSTKLLKHEQDNEDEMIVFLADVWLDHIKVLEKLRSLFQGYAEFPPVAFVFMGNFLSTQHGSGHAQILKTKLKALAEIITQFPELAQKSKFIFVPGPSDPASPSILPRPPLPQTVTEEFQNKIPSSIFTSNPCRIQYCTQEIVVIREDLITKLCRNTIYFPTSGEIPEHFAKTIICQAHLAPLALSVCPVYWAFDAALQLYPLPDLVVTGDQFTAFTTSYMDCQVINPGSFPKSEFSFKVYVPALHQVEDSQIPSE